MLPFKLIVVVGARRTVPLLNVTVPTPEIVPVKVPVPRLPSDWSMVSPPPL
jgi:hypothetical protein